MMTSVDFSLATDHFSLLGMTPGQGIDLAALDMRYREVQAQVHPDKHAHAGSAQQRLAMQWATRVNEAYQTLKSPLLRARYLLQLNGFDPQVDRNTAMPADFLMAQMALREAVAEAKVGADETALEDLRRGLVSQIKHEHALLQRLLDEERDFPAASTLVRQLMFQNKLLHDIDDALEAVTS